MLRDGLLSSRHDEIARCLSSRKRKLSELYYATVFPHHPKGTNSDPLSRQKEAAFLDANDLTKYVLPSPPLALRYGSIVARYRTVDHIINPLLSVLSRGRYYDESTLPERPQLQALLPQTESGYALASEPPRADGGLQTPAAPPGTEVDRQKQAPQAAPAVQDAST
ncbi:hypothetical protein FQN49_007158, partial [Arthroderma sp. PD_2]